VVVVAVQNHVVGHGVCTDQAELFPVLGDVCHAHGTDLTWGPARNLLAVEDDRAGNDTAQTRNGLDQLALTVTLDPGNPDNLSCTDIEVDSVQRPGPPIIVDDQIQTVST